MIVHTHKSPGYAPKPALTSGANVYDVSQPILVLFWAPKSPSKAIYMQRHRLSAWLEKNSSVNIELYEMKPANMPMIVHALVCHKINESSIEVMS